MVGPFMPDAEKLAAVRDGLPATGAGIYLDTPVCGPLPAETARAMAEIADWELTTGRAQRDRATDLEIRMDEARAGLAAILGTDVDGIELTHGVSDGLRRATHAIDWSPGDRALVVGLQPAAAGAIRPPLTGVEVDVLELPIDPDSSDDLELISAVSEGLTPSTRLLVCPHVTSTGRVLPIERLASTAHAADSLIVVDGTNAAGAISVGVDGLDADIYVVPGWAWLLGPEGLGGMVVGARARDRRAAAPVAGDFHFPSVVGLARSCGWLSMYVGLEWIFERTATLAASTRTSLAAIQGVEVLARQGYLGPTIAFRIGGWEASTVLEELGSRVFALASVIAETNAIRIGTGFFNTEDELDRFVSAVELLAAHTPGTLPPRRQLTIIGGDR